MLRNPLSIGLLVVCVALGACGKKNKSETGGESAVKIEPRPDDGPKLKLKTGAEPVTKGEPVEVAAVGAEAADGHVYVRARLPFSPSYISLRGDRPGFAFHMDDEVYVRLVGADMPTEVTLMTRTTAYDKPTAHTPVKITMSTSTGEARSIYLSRVASYFNIYGKPSFWQFAEVRLDDISKAIEGRAAVPARNRNEMDRMMDLYTGSLSAREALQTDRELAATPGKRAETIPLSELKGPPIAAHPWEEMLKDLKKEPSVEPLAARVPNDMLYLHFHDIRTFIGLSRDLDSIVTPVMRSLEDGAGDAYFIERIENQLALGRTQLAETFGHMAVQGVAIVSSDPYVREGNDVSVLFHVKDKAALQKTLEMYLEKKKQSHGEIQTTTYPLGKYTVKKSVSKDNAVYRHELDLGDVVVVSNSPGAIAELAAVADGKKPALASSGEFRYFRALYPFSTTEEDGFLFLSDAFVARTVGPQKKILAARRAQARFDLETVANATLLYGWLEGARAKSLADLQTARLLVPGETAHMDGSPIAWSIEAGPSSRWGSLAGLTPLIDISIEKVTAEERDAYNRFSDSYQRYWRFMDPIGVRIRRQDNGKKLAIDARMMPLIEFSDYNEVAEMVGQARITEPRVPGVGQLSLGIGKDAELRKLIDGLADNFLNNKQINIGWLGDWVSIGVADRSGLWDAAVAFLANPAADKTSQDESKGVIARLPIFAMAHVSGKTGLVATLTGLKTMANSTAPGMVEWGPNGKYKDVDVVRIQVKEDDFPIQLHYAIVKDVFVIALERATLEHQIDGVLQGAVPMTAAKDAVGAVAQSWLSLRPSSAGYLMRSLAVPIDAQVHKSSLRGLDAYEVLARGLPGWPEQGGRLAALRYLGYEPSVVHGGSFGRDADGFFEHSLYGSPGAEKRPDIPVKDSPLTKALLTLASLELGLAFEGDGKTRALHTQLTWERTE